LIEENPEFYPRVQHIYETMARRQDTLCTSVFTIGEVLTGPYKKGATDVVSTIRNVIRPPNVEVIPFDLSTADRYAKIRSTNSVSPADAIHLASAAEGRVDLFLTNDRRLQGLVIPGIDFIAGLDVNLF
jgi:predicted nucleic acid-binding protein